MKEFKYQDIEFVINNAQENYAIEVQKNRKMQKKAETLLRQTYDEYDGMDDAMKDLPDDMVRIYGEIMDLYIDRWIGEGYYDLDRTSYIQDYLLEVVGEDHELYIDKAYEQLEDEYTDIVMTQEQKEEYRRLRKASRGRMVGGGFGLSGAIKGAATAGAVNMVTGIGHSLFNAVGNFATSISTNSKKSKLYKSSVDMLVDALVSDVDDMKYADMLFAKNNEGVVYQIPDSKECHRAEAILDNWREGKISSKSDSEILTELFNINPYEKQIYDILLEERGDSEGKLAEIASFFGLEDYLNDSKIEEFDYIYSQNPKKTWEDYKELKKDLNDIIRKYGMDKDYHVTTVLDEVNQKNKTLYVEACTWNGVKYKTPEEVAKAKLEAEQIHDIEQGAIKDNLDSIKASIAALKCIDFKYMDPTEALKKLEKKRFIAGTKKEKETLAGIKKEIDYSDKESIKKGLDKVKECKFEYISQSKAVDELQKRVDNFETDIKTFYGQVCESVEQKAQMEALLMDACNLIIKEDYKSALEIPNKCPTEPLKNVMRKCINDAAQENLKSTISTAKESAPSVGDTLGGTIGTIIFGLIARHFLIKFFSMPLVFNILFIILMIGGVMVWVEESGERKAKKHAIRKIEQINKMGYCIRMD